jgi:hypothetical protein
MRQSVCRTSRSMGAFLSKHNILRKYMTINCLTIGYAPLPQNDLGVERPVTARVKNSCRYWPRRFHEVSVRA